MRHSFAEWNERDCDATAFHIFLCNKLVLVIGTDVLPNAPRACASDARFMFGNRLSRNCSWSCCSQEHLAAKNNLAMRIRNIAAFARFVESRSAPASGVAQALQLDAATSSLQPQTWRPHASLRLENGYSVIELHNPAARNALTPLM